MHILTKLVAATIAIALPCAPLSAEKILVAVGISADVKVSKRGTITAKMTVKRDSNPQAAYDLALRAIAIKSRELGFGHFILTEDRSGTWQHYGSAQSHESEVTAIPMNMEGDPAPGLWMSVSQILDIPGPDIPLR